MHTPSFSASLLMLIGFVGHACGQTPTSPEKYEVLGGEGSSGSGFIIQYYNHLCGVTSLHQFDGKSPSFLERPEGIKIALRQDKIIKQKDVQTQVLTDESAAISFLAYQPRFRLEPHESVWIFDASGAATEAKLDFLTLALEYNSIEGPKEMRAKLGKAIRARGASGSPVIQKSTGAVVGVLLGANDPEAATIISFETLCLPDLAAKPAPKPAPVYADPKQKAAHQSFEAFAKRMPTIHWKASEIYFKAFNSGSPQETQEEFIKDNHVSEVEVNLTPEGLWQGSFKLGDDKIPSEFWRFQFLFKENAWALKGGQKILGGSTIDLFRGDRIMKDAFDRALSGGASGGTTGVNTPAARVSGVAGGVDSRFKAEVGGGIRTATLQADGKILIGGFFGTVGGVERKHLARLNPDGTLDTTFNPGTDDVVTCVTIQNDNKILIGGRFKKIGGESKPNLARLHFDGTLDQTFVTPAPLTKFNLNCVVLQPDGKILIAGQFEIRQPSYHRQIARLNSDGSLDDSFNTNAAGIVSSAALQPDGKIIIAGSFKRVLGSGRFEFGEKNGIEYTNVARLNTDGTIDTTFQNPQVEGFMVYCVAVQPDGKVLIGGANFKSVGGLARGTLARLNADGSVDAGFNPRVSSDVICTTLQADGKILVGGYFTRFGGPDGISRRSIARLNLNGEVDMDFDPNVDRAVESLPLQMDGKVVMVGGFSRVGGKDGAELKYIARVNNDAGFQSLVVSNNQVKWLRKGAVPEVESVVFDYTTDRGATWTTLGEGRRMAGGWEKSGVTVPAVGHIRARARTSGGYYNGSSWVLEMIAAFSSP